AALRFQQQRSEIMNRLFQLVNNFLNYFVATIGVQLRVRPGSTTALDRTASLLPPRCVSVSAKEA
ncbi:MULTISPECIES: hypothetical protein, partial [unclassified Burkholderia]|uniref:hypothetical protein n=1 Tax=unclassified Burkholderia TaxID=2613784 RepID=UPI000752E973